MPVAKAALFRLCWWHILPTKILSVLSNCTEIIEIKKSEYSLKLFNLNFFTLSLLLELGKALKINNLFEVHCKSMLAGSFSANLAI